MAGPTSTAGTNPQQDDTVSMATCWDLQLYCTTQNMVVQHRILCRYCAENCGQYKKAISYNSTTCHKIAACMSVVSEPVFCPQLPRAKDTAALSGGGLKRLVKSVGDTMFNLTAKMTESDQVPHAFLYTMIITVYLLCCSSAHLCILHVFAEPNYCFVCISTNHTLFSC